MTTLTDRLADLASGVLLSTAEVTGVSRLPAGFVRVELTTEAFQTAAALSYDHGNARDLWETSMELSGLKQEETVFAATGPQNGPRPG